MFHFHPRNKKKGREKFNGNLRGQAFYPGSVRRNRPKRISSFSVKDSHVSNNKIRARYVDPIFFFLFFDTRSIFSGTFMRFPRPDVKQFRFVSANILRRATPPRTRNLV